MFTASVMLRQAYSLRKLLKNRSNAAFLWHNGSRTMSSAAPPHKHFDVEGEPNFLEMVEQYVENARGIALQKLVTRPPRPGRRPQPLIKSGPLLKLRIIELMPTVSVYSDPRQVDRVQLSVTIITRVKGS